MSYMPKDVRVLFVGESPPASGNFFYFGTGNLFNYTKEAFERAFNVRFNTPLAFLNFFKNCGCYLEDLIPIPGLNVNDYKNIQFPVNYPLHNQFPTLLDWYIERFQCCWLNNKSIRPIVIIVVVKRVFDILKRKFNKRSVTYVSISDGQVLEDAWKESKIVVFTDDSGEGLPFPVQGWQSEYVKRLEKILKKLKKATILKNV